MDKKIRLAHLMALRGLTSRRAAEEWIREGRVQVNGELVEHPLVLVDPDEDHVRVDGRVLPPTPPKVYYLLYKPKGYITGRDDPEGRKGVHELLDGVPFRLEPVGRLDFDTEGALILTNDGDLAHALMHPSNHVPRRYLAKVYRTPDEKDIHAVETGVFLEDGRTTPGKMRVVEVSDGGNAWVEVTVTEGRNRLIRRMFAQLGHPVSKLRRESFATVSIRGMERGQVRELTGVELQRVQEIAQGRNPQKTGRKKKGFAIAKPKGRPQARKRKLAAKKNP
ncbi:MAG: rRNA pseudouridine synthase [Deltaproteobacteria bacterium]|nr:rRNA pseudouridine synthase [Deltaproteobacteria bacterium]